MRKIKKFKYLILVVVFLGLVFVLAGKFDLSKIKKAWIGGPKTVKLCYQKYETTDNGAKGEYNLMIEITGDKIKGELKSAPAEGLPKNGLFEGEVVGFFPESNERETALFWQAESLGAVSIEELRVIFNEELASVGLGLMEQRYDGVYVYKNVENVAYTLSLLATPCKNISKK